MSQWLIGKLSPYWEQGWEGSFLPALDVEGATGPQLPEVGDLLDLIDGDGELLWSGTYSLRKRRFWERHKLKKGVYLDTVLRGLSYGQWMEWLWTQPSLEARLLKKAAKEASQILYPTLDRKGQRPLRWRDAKQARWQGREVLDWSLSLGTYGMGGPGFFGLQLASNSEFPEEWLVLTLWGAGGWLLLDGTWMEAHPKYYDRCQPLYSNFGEDQTWDQVTSRLQGSFLTEARINERSSFLALKKDENEHTLEVPADGSLLSPFGGSEEERSWDGQDSFLDAWVFTDQILYCSG